MKSVVLATTTARAARLRPRAGARGPARRREPDVAGARQEDRLRIIDGPARELGRRSRQTRIGWQHTHKVRRRVRHRHLRRRLLLGRRAPLPARAGRHRYRQRLRPGHKAEPTYKGVSARSTGHTEAVQLIFDPGVVSYADLLEIYWDRLGDDATRANAVGNDRGPQYRPASTRFPRNSSPPRRRLYQSAKASRSPSATEVERQRGVFWPAEEYHRLPRRAASPRRKRRRPIRCYG